MRTFLFFENSIVAYGAFKSGGKTDVFYGIKPDAKEKKLHQPFLTMMKGLENMEFAEQIEFLEANKEDLHIRKFCYSYDRKFVSIGEPEPSHEFISALKKATQKEELTEKDCRIETGLSPKEIRKELICLTEAGIKHDPLLSMADFELFLKMAFRGFEPTPENKVIMVGSPKRRGLLRYVLYQFYCNCKQQNVSEYYRMYNRIFAPEMKLHVVEKHFADPVNLPHHLC